jgi:L-fuculose-phosphate aldolase
MVLSATDVIMAKRPPLPDISPQAELALLARSLWKIGYNDQLAGHISYRQPDGTILVNPFALAWDEITASDILRIDANGNLLEGKWDVTPAIALHLELHARRPDVHVAVHNHPDWGTLWADMQEEPGVYDQTSAFVSGGIAVYREYGGPVVDESPAAAAVEALGTAPMALLGNHGVFVVAADIVTAYLRGCTLEWRCKQAWRLRVVKAGVPLDNDVSAGLDKHFALGGYPQLWWEANIRREIRNDPTVLS